MTYDAMALLESPQSRLEETGQRQQVRVGDTESPAIEAQECECF